MADAHIAYLRAAETSTATMGAIATGQPLPARLPEAPTNIGVSPAPTLAAPVYNPVAAAAPVAAPVITQDPAPMALAPMAPAPDLSTPLVEAEIVEKESGLDPADYNTAMMWSCWVFPLMIAEVILQFRKL